MISTLGQLSLFAGVSFISVSNEPNGHACMSAWRMPNHLLIMNDGFRVRKRKPEQEVSQYEDFVQ